MSIKNLKRVSKNMSSTGEKISANRKVDKLYVYSKENIY